MAHAERPDDAGRDVPMTRERIKHEDNGNKVTDTHSKCSSTKVSGATPFMARGGTLKQ
jgi:hypothetical protein